MTNSKGNKLKIIEDKYLAATRHTWENISGIKRKDNLNVSYLFAFMETIFKSMTTSGGKQDALLQVCKVLVKQMHAEIWHA